MGSRPHFHLSLGYLRCSVQLPTLHLPWGYRRHRAGARAARTHGRGPCLPRPSRHGVAHSFVVEAPQDTHRTGVGGDFASFESCESTRNLSPALFSAVSSVSASMAAQALLHNSASVGPSSETSAVEHNS